MANAVRTAMAVAVVTLLGVAFVAVSPTDAIDIGDTCPCAQVGGGSGQCIRFVSGTETAGSCTIETCGSSFKCVPDADATHVCLAQAGSGQSPICKGGVKQGQTSCSCSMEPVTGGSPSLVPSQTTPGKPTPAPTASPRPTVAPPPCTSNRECGVNKVCVSGTCEAADLCTNGKKQVCDNAYQRATGKNDNRAKCCPATSQCVKSGVQAGRSTACSTNCGKKCDPFCSLSPIKGVPMCSNV